MSGDSEKMNALADKKADYTPVYFYEFAQPNFVVSQVLIEHDENGKGKISFLKQGLTETVSDPLQLSSESY